jgi:hypothetical protein
MSVDPASTGTPLTQVPRESPWLEKQSYWLILPIRGLRLNDTGVPSGGFFRENWCHVSRAQFDLLGRACRDNSSLSGNLDMLRQRLNPDSIMLVEYGGDLDAWRVFEAYDEAETLIGALNMVLLLERRPADQWLGDEPAPIFRARYLEHCDLPMAIDRDGLWLAGHSTFSWAALQGPFPDNGRSTDNFLSLLKDAPPVIKTALQREKQPNELQLGLEAALRALTGAFQATSVGQFIAGAFSSIEWLLGDNWSDREERLGAMLPTAYHSRLKELLEARHEFVHAARQPPRDQGFLGLCALSMVVQVWTVIARMPETYLSRADLWYCVRAFADGDAFADRHPGPDHELGWIHRYLVASHPSKYQTSFFVRGAVYCPNQGCGRKLGKDQIVSSNAKTLRLRCDNCAQEFEASFYSNE